VPLIIQTRSSLRRLPFLTFCRVVSPVSGAGRAQNYVKLFVGHKTTQNTLNKFRVAATELPQLLSQNTNMFAEATGKSRYQT